MFNSVCYINLYSHMHKSLLQCTKKLFFFCFFSIFLMIYIKLKKQCINKILQDPIGSYGVLGRPIGCGPRKIRSDPMEAAQFSASIEFQKTLQDFIGSYRILSDPEFFYPGDICKSMTVTYNLFWFLWFLNAKVIIFFEN